jgi:hypothetical protein
MMSKGTLAVEARPRVGARPVQVAITLETAVGLIAAFFIGFFIPVALGSVTLAALLLGNQKGVWALLPLTLVTGRLAFLTAQLAARASDGRITDARETDPALPPLRVPFVLAMAAQLTDWNWYWRPWLGLWWLAHFACAAALGHLVALEVTRGLNPQNFLGGVLLMTLTHFAFLFAANLYLILAARVVSPTPQLCLVAWRYRFLIDTVLAVLLLLRVS